MKWAVELNRHNTPSRMQNGRRHDFVPIQKHRLLRVIEAKKKKDQFCFSCHQGKSFILLAQY
jgi:hypothetical protein